MCNTANSDPDSISRDRIISDMNTNFFVEAGAGSGKTTMLVSRMVAMVEAGKPIDQICAITFTRAAANEFYERFQKLLIERSNPVYVWKDSGHAGQLSAPTDKSRALCAEALRKFDLCFMGTIDAFCKMVLSEHPSEARIPSDANLISDEEAQFFYKQQYVKICAGEYGPDLRDLSVPFRACHRNAEEVFAKGATIFMKHRNVEFLFPSAGLIDIDSTFALQRQEIINAVKCMVEHPEIISESNGASKAAKAMIREIYRILSKKWSTSLSNVVYHLRTLSGVRVLPDAINTYGASLAGLFAKGHARDKSYDIQIAQDDGVYARLGKIQYVATMEFLRACVPCLESAMRDKGNMTYFDYLYYLRNMLKRDAEGNGSLIAHIYERHSYFLIDEFQDTDPLQAEIFFYLCAKKPISKWSACVPKDGSLFIVGDPKQSIYRFRSADVTSFLKIKKLFEQNGGAILSLSRNFRSEKTLCEYFNRVFTKLLPVETQDQSKYEEIPLPAERADEFRGIFTYTSYDASNDASHRDQTDPVQIANIIDRLVDRDEFLIRGADDEVPRKIRYGDIMIITTNKKLLAPIMRFLDEKEIPTKVEGDVPFGENEALLDVYRIYSAVADPFDGIALYGALTGKLIGLAKEEILTYRANGGSVSLQSSFDTKACKDATACLVAEKIEKLKILHYEALRFSPAALFEKILDDFKVYRVVEADKLEVVYYTLELLRNAEKAGSIVSVKDGADYIAQLRNKESDQERCLSLSDQKDAVHMANLHKVKGLEAPVVILAGAPKLFNSSNTRFEHGDTGSTGYLFSLPKPDYKGNYFATGDYPEAVAAEERAGEAENSRKIYVASTRARNALILCDYVYYPYGKESRDSAWKPIMEKDLPDFFQATVEPAERMPIRRQTADSAALYEDAGATCVLNDRSREEATYSERTPSHLPLTSKMSEETGILPAETVSTGADADAEKASGSGTDKHGFAALLGTMMHKLMEMLVSSKNALDVDDAVDEIIREYRTPTMEPYEKELASKLKEAAEKMRSGGYAQTNGVPQDILKKLLDAGTVYCEVPFSYAQEGKDGKVVWNGVMDVVYEEGGRWHILDYKTNADGSDLDKKYKAQLGAYIAAFKETTGNDADAQTYHINL